MTAQLLHEFYDMSYGQNSTTRKALTRGRIDHLTAGVTYLQFSISVCFSST